jgi:hypothetical protein
MEKIAEIKVERENLDDRYSVHVKGKVVANLIVLVMGAVLGMCIGIFIGFGARALQISAHCW